MTEVHGHRLYQTVEAVNRCIEEGRPQAAIPLLEYLLSESGWTGDVLHGLTHDLATALRQLVSAQLASGDPAATETAIRAMAVPIPNDLPPDRLRNRAHVLQNIGTDFMMAGHWESAVTYMRAALALYPCPSFANNLVTALGNLRRPSVLSDYCDALTLKDIAVHIVLACQPKSGSTFLRNVLLEVTGFRDLYLCHHTELASQDLFYPVLLEYAVKPTVTHQHFRATRANVQIAEAFGIRPVVLVRNLYDVIVSLRDYFSDGAVHGTLLDVDEWMRSSPERQSDLLIDLVVPWHLEFLAGWHRVSAQKRLPVMWMTYEEMVADKLAAVRNVLSFHGLGTTNERIEAALRKVEAQPERNRFNRGISGRGNQSLSGEQKARIRKLTQYYPDIDFTPYGL